MFLYELSFIILGLTSLLITIFILKGFIKNQISSYHFVIPVFIIFYSLPVFIDYLSGIKFTGPAYSFTIFSSLEDQSTTVIYNIYISLVLWIFYYFSKSKKILMYKIDQNQILNLFGLLYKWKWILYLILSLPIILVLFSNDYGFYSVYADRVRQEANLTQTYAAKIAALSIPLIVVLINEKIYRFKRNPNVSYLIGILFLFLLLTADFYIHGKRSIVASFVFLLIVSLTLTKVVSKKTIFIMGTGVVTLFVLFLKFYGKNIEKAQGIFEVYQGLRIDFSRDYTLKFVIFHELINGNYVLPYKGASYLFLLTFYIPRSLWSDKPAPYAVYFTNSALGNFGESYFYGWGLTTSFVSEAVSNLGVLGLVVFPLFYIYSINKIELIKKPILKILGYLIMVLLLVIHPMGIMTLILLFFILLFFSKFKFTFGR